jgi:serine/threonine protein phosphatase PrpC
MKTKEYIELLFKSKGIIVPSNLITKFQEFVDEKSSIESVNIILENQMGILKSWKIKNRIIDIANQQIILPNALIGVSYKAKIEIEKFNLKDLIISDIEGLTDTGLTFDAPSLFIEGIPIKSGDLKLKLLYRLQDEAENSVLNAKIIPLLVMVDPKTLWKNLPSNKDDIYWKEDNVSISNKLGTKTIVVSSKRGRSHQNVGSFRDDDFSFKHFDSNGWSIVCLADGAGSYSLSRKGSQIACNAVVEYFESNLNTDSQTNFELKIAEYVKSKDEGLKKEIDGLTAQNLYKAVLFAHNKVKESADALYKSNPVLFNNTKLKEPIDYYHSTLIFTLFKKYDFGYVLLTFGVGDCPAAVMNKEKTETKMLNWLDVGEFGGGTRFVTQSEIFHSTQNPMISRFSTNIVDDFSYLFLMSDGIYDPKFEVEANLGKNEKWLEFLADLEGKNEDNSKIDFNSDNKEIVNQLSTWMDFWSKGNHDDRTLAIIF